MFQTMNTNKKQTQPHLIYSKMKKETKTELAERLVLVQDPILGSKYELQEVEVEIETPDADEQ